MYAQTTPAYSCTGYALMRTFSLNLEPSGSDGWSTHWPVSLNIQPW